MDSPVLAGADAPPLVQHLRAAIADLHREIEATPVARAMVDGTITRAWYGRLLGQLLPAHRALDGRLTAMDLSWRPPTEQVVRGESLAADLAVLGIAVPPPGSAAQALSAWIDGADTDRLMGAAYVVAGSLMGSSMLLPLLRRALGIGEGLGQGLDFHARGAATIAATWRGTLDALNRLPAPPSRREAMADGARQLMGGLLAIYRDVEREA